MVGDIAANLDGFAVIGGRPGKFEVIIILAESHRHIADLHFGYVCHYAVDVEGAHCVVGGLECNLGVGIGHSHAVVGCLKLVSLRYVMR